MELKSGVVAGDKNKFLGKELEFYKLIYELLGSIKNAIVSGDTEAYVRIVSHLADTLVPYLDDEYNNVMEEAQKELDFNMTKRDRYGKSDSSVQENSIIEFTNKKYRELIRLFKTIKIFPQEAEVAWM